MTLKPIARVENDFPTKFGLPRQSGLNPLFLSRVRPVGEYARQEYWRGLEEFSHLWLIWGFDVPPSGNATVRPPRLGGNKRMGVFATRSPIRPNGLGLSCVRIERVEQGVIHVLGADLMDGTPIYDIKPYIPYADAHPEARGGFTDPAEWQLLQVDFPDALRNIFAPDEQLTLVELLSQDPRPRYHDDPQRIYGMPFAGRDVRFRVADDILTVVQVEPA